MVHLGLVIRETFWILGRWKGEVAIASEVHCKAPWQFSHLVPNWLAHLEGVRQHSSLWFLTILSFI
jgi:hypothetical protein